MFIYLCVLIECVYKILVNNFVYVLINHLLLFILYHVVHIFIYFYCCCKLLVLVMLVINCFSTVLLVISWFSNVLIVLLMYLISYYGSTARDAQFLRGGQCYEFCLSVFIFTHWIQCIALQREISAWVSSNVRFPAWPQFNIG